MPTVTGMDPHAAHPEHHQVSLPPPQSLLPDHHTIWSAPLEPQTPRYPFSNMAESSRPRAYTAPSAYGPPRFTPRPSNLQFTEAPPESSAAEMEDTRSETPGIAAFLSELNGMASTRK